MIGGVGEGGGVDGEPSENQPNKMVMAPQYFHTILVPFFAITMPCICGVHRRAVEGSGVGKVGV